MSNLKIQRISDSAFRLWIKGLCYCQMHLTDGLIPREALGPMEARRRDVDELCKPQVAQKEPLWSRIDAFGFKVYNYLKYNDSREQVEGKRKQARYRTNKSRSNAISNASGNALQTAGVTMSSTANTPLSLLHSSDHLVQTLRKENLIVSQELANRGARLLERYDELYSEKRHGAKHFRRQPALDHARAIDLCRVWDDDRLEKLAVICLTTDDDWISKTDRGFAVFASKATWCDERLAAWESQQKRSAN